MSTTSSMGDQRGTRRSGSSGLLQRCLRDRRLLLGGVLTGLVVSLALVGPVIAPYAEGAIVGPPYAAPSQASPLGTDYLGEDVLSRVLEGGRSLVWISFTGTLLGALAGAFVGMTAAVSPAIPNELLMRAMDVLLAFPVLVLLLLFVSMIGVKVWLLPLLLALAFMPQVARVCYGAATEIGTMEFVESAETLGSPRFRIVRKEVLPNLVTPLTVDFGLRLTWAIGILTAMSFLGVGLQPPAAGWGLMIKQNYQGMTLQPYGVVVPIVCVGLFTFGTNLMTEGFARVSGRTASQGGL